MVTRREWLGMTVGAGAALALGGRPAFGFQSTKQLELLTRAIPGTTERIPVVGLGSSATFAQVARTEDVTAVREVLSKMVELGGTVFDTAPSYGASEEVAGRLVQELGIADRLFWATKLNVARDGTADPAAARAQVEASFQRVGRPVIDLIQVHNMGAPSVQLPILREYKQAGKVRYIGITTTSEEQYPAIIEVMRNEEIDFIGIDYAVDNREAEQTILPLARERGIGVLAYAPFGRTRLWSRVAGREVPEWASEFDANSWAQFFLKFVVSNSDITATTPATSQARNMEDNLGGAVGRLPDEAMRRRMIEYVDALPSA
jgi:aryl-alcohol dehydrogenase-like predicted oxidoreductase